MRLIIGLGNPGEQYEKTRHNLGFMVLDNLISKYEQLKLRNTNYELRNRKELELRNSKFEVRNSIMPFRLENQYNAEITQTGGIGQDRTIFAKPVTYMNNSGAAVSKLMNYFKIGSDDILVVCDDIDLDLGIIRIRKEGSSGGHKGLDSIIKTIKDDRFIRVRVGIGSNRMKNIPSEKYVLEKFSADEEKLLPKILDKTGEIVLKWIETGNIEENTIKI